MGSQLKEILENFQEDNVKAVDIWLEGIWVEFNRAIERGDSNVDSAVHPTTARQSQGVQSGLLLSTFAYGGQFHLVPKNFLFLKV
jgi:hypothetical protein